MFKRTLFLIPLLLCAGLLSAKKLNLSISDVILRADLIVVGEIKHDGVGAYSFSVQETIFGDSTLKTIRVKKWKEWTCDRR